MTFTTSSSMPQQFLIHTDTRWVARCFLMGLQCRKLVILNLSIRFLCNFSEYYSNLHRTISVFHIFVQRPMKTQSVCNRLAIIYFLEELLFSISINAVLMIDNFTWKTLKTKASDAWRQTEETLFVSPPCRPIHVQRFNHSTIVSFYCCIILLLYVLVLVLL